MAKYKEMPEVEEYIDLIPILNMNIRVNRVQ